MNLTSLTKIQFSRRLEAFYAIYEKPTEPHIKGLTPTY